MTLPVWVCTPDNTGCPGCDEPIKGTPYNPGCNGGCGWVSYDGTRSTHFVFCSEGCYERYSQR